MTLIKRTLFVLFVLALMVVSLSPLALVLLWSVDDIR